MSFPVRVRGGAIVTRNDSILLIEYEDENGLHYTLPGGGVEAGEGVHDAIKRELQEEASAEVNVGPVAFVHEYIPEKSYHRYGSVPCLTLIFNCELENGSEPRMPDHPDPHQIGVKWISYSELSSIQLFPLVNHILLDYCHKRTFAGFLEDQFLK